MPSTNRPDWPLWAVTYNVTYLNDSEMLGEKQMLAAPTYEDAILLFWRSGAMNLVYNAKQITITGIVEQEGIKPEWNPRRSLLNSSRP